MEIDVTRAKLDELLAVGTEHMSLDYKSTVDFKAHHETIEVTKDVGAFMDHGGYLVIGADDQGGPTGGILPGQEQLFDEASLRPALERYIPAPFTIATRIHDVGGVKVGLLQVLPHPHGFCVFHKQGEYNDPKTGKQVVVFRANEVFTRHGTSSERVDGHDLQRIRNKSIPAEPARPTPAMTPDQLHRSVADAFGRGDKVALIDVLDDLTAATETAAHTGDAAGLLAALDSLTTIAAAAIKYDELSWLDEAIVRLKSIYELGFAGGISVPGGRDRLWLDVIGRVMAVGAIAVAAGRDDLVPRLALCTPVGVDTPVYTNWITHAGIHAARAGFLGGTNGNPKVTFLRGVEVEVGSVPAVKATFRNQDEVQNALAQFDALSAITVWGRAKRDPDDEYPYFATFASYYQDRYEPAIVRLIADADLRSVIFGGSDDDLRSVLRILEAQGRKDLASYGGGGALYVAPEIHRFLNG